MLHSFGSGSDGKYPGASLIYVKGTLYSTTDFGGIYGLGTVFSISTSGAEQVLQGFGASGDGDRPIAGLIEVNATLYGTTSGGEKHVSGWRYGHGSVFALTP